MSAHRVVVTGGQGDLAKALAAEFGNAGNLVTCPGKTELNVADEESVRGYFRDRGCELLICCAGLTDDAPLARVSEASWDRVWAVNLGGARRCAQAVLPTMVDQAIGHILFLSSHSAIHPPIGQSSYAAAKAALLGLTVDLASEYGRFGIRVNAVLPGFLENRMTESVSAEKKEIVRRNHVLGRFNTMTQVASFIRFLHHELPHTSGQWFQLDSRPGWF